MQSYLDILELPDRDSSGDMHNSIDMGKPCHPTGRAASRLWSEPALTLIDRASEATMKVTSGRDTQYSVQYDVTRSPPNETPSTSVVTPESQFCLTFNRKESTFRVYSQQAK